MFVCSDVEHRFLEFCSQFLWTCTYLRLDWIEYVIAVFSLGQLHIDVAHMPDKHSRSDFAFRKWNKLTVVLSSFQNECAPVIILVFCDSPLAAIWPKTGLWCARPPHSPHRLKINHWNPGTFSAPFFGTVLLPASDHSDYTESSSLFMCRWDRSCDD